MDRRNKGVSSEHVSAPARATPDQRLADKLKDEAQETVERSSAEGERTSVASDTPAAATRTPPDQRLADKLKNDARRDVSKCSSSSAEGTFASATVETTVVTAKTPDERLAEKLRRQSQEESVSPSEDYPTSVSSAGRTPMMESVEESGLDHRAPASAAAGTEFPSRRSLSENDKVPMAKEKEGDAKQSSMTSEDKGSSASQLSQTHQEAGAFAVYPDLNTTVPASHHRHDVHQCSVLMTDEERNEREEDPASTAAVAASIEAYAVTDEDHDAEEIVRKMIDDAAVVEAQPIDHDLGHSQKSIGKRRRRILSVFLVVLLIAIIAIAASVASAKSRGPAASESSTSLAASLLDFCGEDSNCWTSTLPAIQRPNKEIEVVDEFGEEIVLSHDGSILAVSANQCTVQSDREALKCASEEVLEGHKAGAVWIYDLTEGAKVVGEFSGIAADELRGNLSGNGNVVALSARRRIVNGTVNTGLVWFYSRTPSSEWVPMGKPIRGIYPYDMAGKDTSLSYDGKTVAVASPSHDKAVEGELNGTVRVYRFNGTDWAQLGSNVIGENSGDQFGWSTHLSKDGSVLAVGARRNDGNGKGEKAGHARVFRYTNNDWIQMGSDIDALGEGDYFGGKLEISDNGSTLAVGAWNHDSPNGYRSGQVRVFRFDGNEWALLGSPINGENVNEMVGQVSMAADGETIAVGAVGERKGKFGYATVYTYNANRREWEQLGGKMESDRTGDNFGMSISISEDGSRVAVGAPSRSSSDVRSGYVVVYDLVQQS